jgi:hypothetical protein
VKKLSVVVAMVAVGLLFAVPAAHASTPAEDHADCVAVFGEAFCHDLECDEWFGLDGCPDSGFRSSDDPAPPRPHGRCPAASIDAHVTVVEAKCAIRKLWGLHDVAFVTGLRFTITGCHHAARGEFAARARVVCVLVGRAPGTVCRGRVSVVETADERSATIHRRAQCRKAGAR